MDLTSKNDSLVLSYLDQRKAIGVIEWSSTAKRIWFGVNQENQIRWVLIKTDILGVVK